MIPPALVPRPDLLAAARDGDLEHLLVFDDAERYGELFEIENRYDWTHLNATGAEIYSRELARRLLELEERAP